MHAPSDDDRPPEPPVRPDDADCCGNGCDPCIFDLFAEEQKRYAQALRAWQERQARKGPATDVSFSDS